MVSGMAVDVKSNVEVALVEAISDDDVALVEHRPAVELIAVDDVAPPADSSDTYLSDAQMSKFYKEFMEATTPKPKDSQSLVTPPKVTKPAALPMTSAEIDALVAVDPNSKAPDDAALKRIFRKPAAANQKSKKRKVV